MTIKIDKLGFRRDGHTNDGDTMVALAQTLARLSAASVTDVTDSSGGSADATAPYVCNLPAADAVNAANAATNLAQKASTETNLNLVKDALLELYTKAAEAAAAVGATGITYNGGGTAADGTIAAIGVAVTAAATGAQASNYNANVTDLNNAFHSVGALINRVAVAVGKPGVDFAGGAGVYEATTAAITIGVGTAADPGVTKARVDADLVKYRDAVATMAARLNSLTAAASNLIVVTP